jgi:hypothetical protein
VEVAFSPQAFQDVVKADAWWRENRGQKDLLSDEVWSAVSGWWWHPAQRPSAVP